MKDDDKNPLADLQNNKFGSIALDRFDYQYHWALCKAFDRYTISSDFAVFVELHEDVVIVDSTQIQDAKFLFNQVKANESKTYTVNEMTRRDKKIKSSQSVLGKMCGSVSGKSFSEKVIDVRLVSTSGFGLSHRDKLKLRIMKLSDICDGERELIVSALKEEIERFEDFPVHLLSFEESDIPLDDYMQHTIYKINASVNKVYPHHFLSAMDIYRILIDGLKIKGKNTFDHLYWKQSLEEKAITYNDVQSVVSKNIMGKSSSDQIELSIGIVDAFDFNTLTALKVKKAIKKYNIHILNGSIFMKNLRFDIQNNIKKHINLENESFLTNDLDAVIGSLSESQVDFFESKNHLYSAIIYEISEIIS